MLAALRSLEARAATVLEVAQPGPAQISQRWHADARARAAAAVDQALSNWEAIAASTNSSSGSVGGSAAPSSSGAGGSSSGSGPEESGTAAAPTSSGSGGSAAPAQPQ